MTDTIHDSHADDDGGRVYAQHQAILTVVHLLLDGTSAAEYRWLDLASGKGQIIAHLDKHLDESARRKISYYAFDAKDDYLKIVEGRAEPLLLNSVHTKVGELSDIGDHYRTDTFNLITLINAVHELRPRSLATVLTESLLRLEPDGLLFLYDMESLPPKELELGAITWTKPEIQEILATLMESLGVPSYRPSVGQWPHRTCNGWHVQIRRSAMDCTTEAIRANAQTGIERTNDKVRELLLRKMEQCEGLLRSITRQGEEVPEEEGQKLRYLYDFWALHLGNRGFE